MKRVYRVSVDPASLAAGAVANTAVAVVGVTRGDIVTAIPPVDLEAGLVLQTCFVNDEDSVTVRLYNPSAGAVDGAAKDWTIVAERIEGGG